VLGVEGRLLSQPQAGLPSFEVKQAAHLRNRSYCRLKTLQ
jgi:hypothetical protein